MPSLVGQLPNQTPAAQQLGRMAYQDPEAVVLEPQASANPLRPGSMVFQLTSDTSLTVKVMGSDGVVRSASLTLS